MLVDVIMPSKTSDQIAPLVMQCIATLKMSEPAIKFNVVLVESAGYRALGQDRTVMYDQDQFCYNHALNLGLRATDNEWVILANNDLYFHPFFMTAILAAQKEDSSIQSFSPWNDFGGWHERAFPGSEYSIFYGYRTSYELAGWCIVTTRKVLNEITLSERCRLWYSDNIYADELQKRGIVHALIRQSIVGHLCSQTIDYSSYDVGKDYDRYIGGKCED